MAYFQILDDKQECYGIYLEGRLFFNEIPQENLNYTWNYNALFPHADAAILYVNGQSVSDVAPPELKSGWDKLRSKKDAFLTSFKKAQIDLNTFCFYDLVPKSFLLEYNFYKTEVTKHVIENYDRPQNYEYLAKYQKLVDNIAYQQLNLDKKAVFLYKAKKNTDFSSLVTYDIFGSITGRLTTKKGSFPILNLDKNHRNMIKPWNDLFVELDYNAADIRTFIALMGKEQPNLDIHDWHIKNIFKEDISRSEAKERFFSWFYNPLAENEDLEKFYDKEYLVDKYHHDGIINNPFDRAIEGDEYHALSYLIQSTSNDIMLNAACEIQEFLKDTGSKISFMIHDSIVLDLKREDIKLLPQLRKIMSSTKLGYFPKTSVSIGKNYRDLKKVEI